MIATLLVVCVLPTLFTLVGLGLCAIEGRVRADPLGAPAGPWIERVIARAGLDLKVEIVPAESPDAYWPNAATLGLSEATYGGTRPKDWAVAAHELGHAINSAAHPAMAWLLPGARLASVLGWRLCVGSLVAAALFSEPAAILLAGLAGLVAVGATALVCADEIWASQHAAALIRSEPSVDEAAASRAVAAMRAAASAYVLGGAGQLLVLLSLPAIAGVVLGEPMAVKSPSDLAFTLVLAMTPVVLLRTALSIWQTVRPEPVPSDLDLWDLLAREARWESVCGIGMVFVVAAIYPAVGGPPRRRRDRDGRRRRHRPRPGPRRRPRRPPRRRLAPLRPRPAPRRPLPQARPRRHPRGHARHVVRPSLVPARHLAHARRLCPPRPDPRLPRAGVAHLVRASVRRACRLRGRRRGAGR